jgi:hypothetical protein
MTGPPPKPPVVIVPAGPGQACARGLPPNALDTLGAGRNWDAERGGWLVPAAAAEAIVAWARRNGRGVEVTVEAR